MDQKIINLWIVELQIHLTFSGGEDFDQRVMDHFVKLYKKKKGKDIRKSNRAVQKLRREVEKAKRTLSSQHQARIDIESFYEGEDFSETLTRARFEELNMVRFQFWVLCCVYIDVYFWVRVIDLGHFWPGTNLGSLCKSDKHNLIFLLS